MAFLENIESTIWFSLKAYTDKMSQGISVMNQHPFYVEYIEGIVHQASESL